MTNRIIPVLVFSINLLLLLYTLFSIPRSLLSQVPALLLFLLWGCFSLGSLILMSFWLYVDEGRINKLHRSINNLEHYLKREVKEKIGEIPEKTEVIARKPQDFKCPICGRIESMESPDFCSSCKEEISGLPCPSCGKRVVKLF